jgi:hypothetical protein
MALGPGGEANILAFNVESGHTVSYHVISEGGEVKYVFIGLQRRLSCQTEGKRVPPPFRPTRCKVIVKLTQTNGMTGFRTSHLFFPFNM